MHLEFLLNILKKVLVKLMVINQLLIKYSQYLSKSCYKGIKSICIKQDVITLIIYKKYLISVCNFLKNHTNAQYKTLIDIVVIDYPLKNKRFEIIYILLSTVRNTRLILKTQLTILSSIFSITSLYSAAA
jgi:NADH dehydrogenase (ubiquinone) Fe-S protein 3